jgi:hypothetical protein
MGMQLDELGNMQRGI